MTLMATPRSKPRRVTVFLALAAVAAALLPFGPAQAADPSNVKWAGVRSSVYGIRPFPSPQGWSRAMTTMSGHFPGSTPVGVWIVGPLSGRGVQLEFPRPNDGRNYGSRIKFASSDKHERFLTEFDRRGIQVWLQVEPGFADIPTVIDLVLGRYKRHPSVIGFGIDVEWFHPAGPDENDPVTDALAQEWEARVKRHKDGYQLFLKHFAISSMPPTYRGDILFVDDSQIFPDYASFLAEMKQWADFFFPSPVAYQIGYQSDKPWWSRLAAPIPQTMGRDLAAQTRQDAGIVWVDFTLRDVLPTN